MLLFLQKRPGPNTEQFGCFAMNIWQMHTMNSGQPWVCPVVPFAPRDNAKVEANRNESWSTAIRAFYERPASDIFDWEGAANWVSLEVFWKASKGVVDIEGSEGSEGSDKIQISKRYHCVAAAGEDSYEFIHSPGSPHKILPWPQRWDIENKQKIGDFAKVYASLPFRIGGPIFRGRATFHWRRGDRGNTMALGQYGNKLWAATMPVPVGKWLAPILLDRGVRELVILTNSGNSLECTLLEKTVCAMGYKGAITWLLSKSGDSLENPLDSWSNDLEDLSIAAGSEIILLSPGGITLQGSAFGRILVAETVRRGITPYIIHL